MLSRTDRRGFLKRMAAAAGTTPLFLSAAARAKSPNDKLNVAIIGVGGIGGSHWSGMRDLGENCVCLCDVDLDSVGDAKSAFPRAFVYQDYRKMFDERADLFDAVMIGTPDHHHYPATIIAMQLGKHVYTQKPLTQTCWEARALTKAAKKHPVATQMGNQGHAGDYWRVIYEMVRSGKLGQIQEVHTWTNRPVWPQGMNRPDGEDEIPANLDWDAWIGPCKMRPFKAGAYHPFVWRGWYEFGAGALGDMACHTMDGTFWALEPGYPLAVEPVQINGATEEAFPNSSVVKWEFGPRNGRPGFLQYWYDGGLFPPKPGDLPQDVDLPGTGNLYIGTKGTMVIPGDYGQDPKIYKDGQIVEVGKLPEFLPRSPGHMREWVMQCKGETGVEAAGRKGLSEVPGAISNFHYAGPMSEAILLGNVAVRLGKRLEYDGPSMRIPNCPEAEEFLTKEYRAGWDFGL